MPQIKANMKSMRQDAAKRAANAAVKSQIHGAMKKAVAAANSDNIGHPSQVREVAATLIRIAKERDLPVLIVGHVTKDGSIAGPRLLEHLVDVVCHFEGDRQTSLRFIRSLKNRFGPTDEVGCFEMTGDGIAEVSGLPGAEYGEILIFENGVRGMVLDLKEKSIGCVVFAGEAAVQAGSVVGGGQGHGQGSQRGGRAAAVRPARCRSEGQLEARARAPATQTWV